MRRVQRRGEAERGEQSGDKEDGGGENGDDSSREGLELARWDDGDSYRGIRSLGMQKTAMRCGEDKFERQRGTERALTALGWVSWTG